MGCVTPPLAIRGSHPTAATMDAAGEFKHQDGGPGASRPDTWRALPTILVTAAHQDWPPLCLCTAAEGLLSLVVDGGVGHGIDHWAGGTGEIRHTTPDRNGRVGPGPLVCIPERSHLVGGGSHGGDHWYRHLAFSSLRSVLYFVLSARMRGSARVCMMEILSSEGIIEALCGCPCTIQFFLPLCYKGTN